MERIVCISQTTICAREVIAGVPGIIVSMAEMIDSLTPLIAHGIEILRSQSATIADDVEIIANGLELIVTMISKGKTGGKEAGKPGVFDVKLSAGLVWIVVFPFMPPHRAPRVPFLTR